MKISIQQLLEQIDQLPKNFNFNYIIPGKFSAILKSVDFEGISVALEKVGIDGTRKSAGMTTDTLRTIADNAFEKVPFSVDSIFNGSGSARSTWEAILANTTQFYTCKVNNQKHLIWIPDSPHKLGEITTYVGEFYERPQENGTHVLEKEIEDYITQFDKESFSAEELAERLSGGIKLAQPDSKTLAIHNFGILYAPHIANGAEIARLAGCEPFSASITDAKKIGLSLRKKCAQHRFERLSSFLSSSPLQQIFYGAPGTGKSNTIKCEVEEKKRIHFRTTFHPDSDYSTFVGCYKPTMKAVKKTVIIGQEEKDVKPLNAGEDSENKITYDFVPQAFTKAYCEAWNKYDGTAESEPVFLIIEEINRGNCAQIFGDIFQLLDRETVGERTGFSTYPIDADEDLKKFLMTGTKEDGSRWLTNEEGIKDGKLCLPPNLYIWATMNTSDQSLFPIDSAFKRRWDWKYMPIDYDKEKWSIVAKGEQYSWSDFLKKMNNLVAGATDSEDKMLGFYFAKAKNGIIDADTFVGKVVFYLWNDVFKDYGLPKEILNGVESKEFAFRNFFMVDGRANEDMVKRLLDNLGVAKPADTGSPVEDTEHQDEA